MKRSVENSRPITRAALAIAWCGAALFNGLDAVAATLPLTAAQDVGAVVNARSIALADIDADGDTDIVAAAQNAGVGDDLVWFENGGSGTWTERLIDSNFGSANYVVVIDMDDNGTLDVVACRLSTDVDQISFAWYSNDGTPGSGEVWASEIIVIGLALPNGLAVFDVDLDGDLDVVGAHTGTGAFGEEVIWYENDRINSPGSAWPEHAIDSTIGDPWTVFQGDFNDDGLPDVLAASAQSDFIAWYENDGTPSVGEWTQHSVVTSIDARWAVPADIDGDGALDVVGVGKSNNRVAWYRNVDGAGTSWAATNLSPALTDASTVTVADFDKDGDPDIVAGGETSPEGSNSILWWENNGDGSAFTSHTIVSDSFQRTAALQTGDLDEDGDLDLAAAEFLGNRVVWFENNTIHRNSEYTDGSHTIDAAFTPASFATADDLNQDGFLDVVGVSSGGGGLVSWWASDGTPRDDVGGDGNSWTESSLSSSFTGASTVTTGDIDVDGAPDIVAGGNALGYWHNGDGVGGLWHARTIDAAFVTSSAVVADIDDDGYNDVVATSATAGDLLWYENRNDIGTDWTFPHTIDSAFAGAASAAVGDIDADGTPDVLAVSPSVSRIHWWANDGSPGDDSGGDGNSWTEQTVSNAFTGASVARLADVDDDGDLDVLAGGSHASDPIQAAIFLNANGLGTVWTKQTLAGNSGGAFSLEAADLDCDGDTDVLVRLRAGLGSTITPYVNEGGAWSAGTSIAPGFGELFRLADLDRDGDPDLVIPNTAGAALLWYENRGGQFRFASENASPGFVEQSATQPILRIFPEHLGRAGDSDLEIVTLQLLFESAASVNMTSAEANALIANLYVYRDNGDELFSAGTDTLVKTVASFGLVGGVETITFTDGDANVQVAHGAAPLYFVVAEATANAATQAPDRFIVTHVTEASSTAEDRVNDIGLAMAYTANVASLTTIAIDPATTPVITIAGANPLDHEAGSAYADPGATATDSVLGVVAVTDVSSNVNIGVLGTYTVTYNYTDSGTTNAAVATTRTVHVVDTTAPVITRTGAASVTIEAGSAYNDAGATASDSFEVDLTASIVTVNPVDTSAPGDYTVTYNVSDSSGNPATQVTRTVTVEDTTAPVITLTGSASVSVEAGGAYNDAGATASDSIDGDLTASIVTVNAVNTSVLGDYTVTYNVSDASGNPATQVTRTVTVEDTTAPVITLTGSASVTVEAGSAYNDAGATASDSFVGDLTASIVTVNPVNTSVLGDYTVTYNVSDASGNPATQVTRTVTVEDTTAPVITLTGSASVKVSKGTAYIDAGATASDSFEGDLTVAIVVVNPVDTNVPGVYSVTYNVTDSSGNPATPVTRTVTVFVPGDVNGDDSVNALDIQLVINAALGIDISPFNEAADINGDDNVNALDIQLVINAALGIVIVI